MEKKRNPYWDNLKLVLIVLVVIGHFLLPVSPKGQLTNTVYYWIYLFHMPAFIFVSGFFSKNYVQKDERRAEKLIGFIALFVFFTVCYWIIQVVFGYGINYGEILSTTGAPWYMLAMFFWYIFIPFISQIKPFISFPLVIILGLLVGSFKDCGTFLVLSQTIAFFPFFLAGYYFNGSLIKKIKPWMRIVSILFLILCAVFLFFYYDRVSTFLKIIYASSSYPKLGLSRLYGTIFRFLWYIVAFAMTAAIMCIISSKQSLVTYIGERTLGIYIIHRLLRDVFNNLGGYRFLRKDLSLLLICIVISVLIVFITSVKPVATFFNRFFHMGFLIKPEYRLESKKTEK